MPKDRLAVREWSQIPGIGYGGMFAPVLRLQSICMVLAIAAELKYEIYMMDALTTFFNTNAEEEVFFKISSRHERSKKARVPSVTKIKKSLYGLIHAPIICLVRWIIASATSSFNRSSLTRACTFTRTISASCL